MNKQNLFEKKESYFGDKSIFAIRYLYDQAFDTEDGRKNHFAYCHLVLSGEVVGDPLENCLLGTWLESLCILNNCVKNNYESICYSEFNERIDRELIEIVQKSNQFEDEFDQSFAYLPFVEGLWDNCHVSMDDTTDGWGIAMIGIDGKVKIVAGEYSHLPDQFKRLLSATMDREYFVTVTDAFISFIKENLDQENKELSL